MNYEIHEEITTLTSWGNEGFVPFVRVKKSIGKRWRPENKEIGSSDKANRDKKISQIPKTATHAEPHNPKRWARNSRGAIDAEMLLGICVSKQNLPTLCLIKQLFFIYFV